MAVKIKKIKESFPLRICLASWILGSMILAIWALCLGEASWVAQCPKATLSICKPCEPGSQAYMLSLLTTPKNQPVVRECPFWTSDESYTWPEDTGDSSFFLIWSKQVWHKPCLSIHNHPKKPPALAISPRPLIFQLGDEKSGPSLRCIGCISLSSVSQVVPSSFSRKGGSQPWPLQWFPTFWSPQKTPGIPLMMAVVSKL